MAACPIVLTPSLSRRRLLVLTQRRLEANRRNAARSTGPRTARGKARVARNAVKHGFFVAPERWAPEQHRDYIVTLDGLRADFKPRDVEEAVRVRVIAEAHVRKAAVLRYEGIAALKYHQQCERELEARIAAAKPREEERLRAYREELRAAGLWGPTIPGPREANAIMRYLGSLERSIWRAAAELALLRRSKAQKQTHLMQQNRGIFGIDDAHQPSRNVAAVPSGAQIQSPPPAEASSRWQSDRDDHKNAKTNPLSSTFTGNFPGNRHQRRKAAALARRQT